MAVKPDTAAPIERPILINGPMIEAIIAGRKSMTRRILAPQPQIFRMRQDDPGMGVKKDDWCRVALEHTEGQPWPRVATGRVITRQEVRYRPGLRLWVREAFARISVCPIVSTIDNPMVVYRAADNRTDYGGPWKPSIHMPRDASRITLEVTSVKIERLQDINEDEACAEGVQRPRLPHWPGKPYTSAFRGLWNDICGSGAWEQNPFVVAIRFRVVTP